MQVQPVLHVLAGLSVRNVRTVRGPGILVTERATPTAPQGLSVEGAGPLAVFSNSSSDSDAGSAGAQAHTTLSFEGQLGPEEPGDQDDDYYSYSCDCDYGSTESSCLQEESQPYYLCGSSLNDSPSLTKDRSRLVKQIPSLLDQPAVIKRDIAAGGLGRLSRLSFNGAMCDAMQPEPDFAVWNELTNSFDLTVPWASSQLPPKYGRQAHVLDVTPQPSCGSLALLDYAPVIVSCWTLLCFAWYHVYSDGGRPNQLPTAVCWQLPTSHASTMPDTCHLLTLIITTLHLSMCSPDLTIVLPLASPQHRSFSGALVCFHICNSVRLTAAGRIRLTDLITCCDPAMQFSKKAV